MCVPYLGGEGKNREDSTRLLSVASHERIRGNGHRLKCRKFQSNHSFAKEAEHWNITPTAVLEPPLIVVLKTQLDTVLTNSL